MKTHTASSGSVTYSSWCWATSWDPLRNSHYPHYTLYYPQQTTPPRIIKASANDAAKSVLQSLNHDWILLKPYVILITFCLHPPLQKQRVKILLYPMASCGACSDTSNVHPKLLEKSTPLCRNAHLSYLINCH